MLSLCDRVHVPYFDGYLEDTGDKAIGTIIKLVPFMQDGTSSEFDRVLVDFGFDDNILCWADEVIKLPLYSKGQ